MTNKKSSVGILGAGISGLSIAYALDKNGVDVTVYEKGSQAGGVIRSIQSGGWITEHGPNTLMVRTQKIWDLLDELDLHSEILEANQKAKKRYVVKHGKPLPLPLSLMDFIRTDLISWKAKLRLLKEPFISATDKPDESIANFIKRRLGKEVLDYVVNPFVGGIFAGDPAKLSVKHTFTMSHEFEQKHGSVFKGMIKQRKNETGRKALISFQNGVQTLPEALSKNMSNLIKLKHRIIDIHHSGKTWELQFEGGQTHAHDVVISTLPAHSLYDCMKEEKATGTISRLGEIPYAPMSVIHLGYKKEKIHHPLDGYGMLVPEVEPFKILGALFSSSLFPDRAPEDHSLLTIFVGGARNPELAHQSKDSLVEKVQRELDQLLSVSGTPEFVRHTFWKKAIPQYEVGYDSYLHNIEKLEKKLPGFYVAGNMRGGVSVPDCIINGFETAEKIATLLNK